jgi:hypothetical protein
MKTNTVELLFSGKNLSNAEIKLNSQFTRIVKIENAKNPFYKYVTIEIGEQQTAGTLDFEITLKGAKKKSIFKYQLLKRTGNLNWGQYMWVPYPSF